MAIDKSLYVEKKIPTFSEYAQRRMQGESYDQILAQTIQERRDYHESIPGYYDVPAYTEATRGMSEDELITGNTTEDRLAREKWLREWQQKRAEERAQAAQETPQRRQNAGSRFWEGIKSIFGGNVKEGVSEMKAANEDAKATVDWEGRDELIEQYRALQRDIEADERRLERGQPVDAKKVEENRTRLAELKAELEKKDEELGNGQRDYSGTDKFDSFVGGTGGKIIHGVANAGATVWDFMQKTGAYDYSDAEMRRSAVTGMDVRQKAIDEYNSAEAQKKRDDMYAAVDAYSDLANASTARLKNGMGLVGQAAVDIGQNVVEMGFDAGVAALTGGSALVPMFVRVFGESAAEARQEGATIDQQMGYGLTKGAIEVATERMFDGVARIYGAGAADEVVEKLIGKLSKSDAGRTFLRFISSGVGEGMEEVVSDLLSPVADRIYKEAGSIDPAEVLYDFFIGATIGMLGGGTNFVPGQNGTLSRNAEANRQLSLRDAAKGSVENQVDAAWDVMTGRATSEQQQAREARGNAALEKYSGKAEKAIRNAYKDANQELDDRDAKLLADGFVDGGADLNTYILGTLDAYKMGKSGMFSAEDAAELSEAAAALDPVQVRHAWSIGAGLQAAEREATEARHEAAEAMTGETVNKATPEGKTRLEGELAALGEHAEEAAEVYEDGQDVGGFAAAMERAAEFYAAGGQDLDAAYQKAKAGGDDIIRLLTPEQIAAAKKIGAAIQQERAAQIEQSSARFDQLRQKAAEVLQTRQKNAEGLRTVNEVLRDARAYEREEGKALERSREAMNNAEEGTEAHEQARAEAEQHQRNIDGTRQTIQSLEEDRKTLGGGVNEGRVTLAKEDGRHGDMSYKAVDESKLTAKQRKALDAVGVIAEALGLDVTVVDAKGFGGEYIGDGKMLLNIGEVKIGNVGKIITMASMSHEMVHWMKEYAPKQYKALEDRVRQTMDADEFSGLVRQQRNAGGLSYEDAVEEVVANACQPLLQDSKVFAQIAREDMTLAEKILEFLRDFVAKVKEAFDDIDFHDNLDVYRAVRAVEKDLDNLQTLYDEAMLRARENMQAKQALVSEAFEEGMPVDAAEALEGRFQKWTGEEPKKTQYGFKLMNVDENGLPHAMFIDAANPYELGQWYTADSPKMENLVKLEPGYAYLVDENDVADESSRRPVRKEKGSFRGLPGKAAVNKATAEGKRWMVVDQYADGSKSVHNVGINGSGGVSTFALRPGIHAVDIPSMSHIGSKSEGSSKIDTRRPNQQWFLIEYPVDVDYNQEAYSHETKDIREHLPERGWYSFQTNSGAEARQHWFITGGMKVVGAISEADARRYARERGFEEDLPWKMGKSYSEDNAIDLDEYIRTTKAQPTPSKDEMRQRIENERGGKYQYVGEKSETADRKALETAKNLISEGEDAETVRQVTGWFRGRDGKWRYEIDDSSMKWESGGDVQFRQNHPEYDEYRKLLDKMFNSPEALTEHEHERLVSLDEIWSGEISRLSQRVKRGGAKLGDVLRHEELFKAYPWLKDMRVEYADLGRASGRLVARSDGESVIQISKDNHFPTTTLVHEIQHAIQHAEGFARGSSKEYWEDRLKHGYAEQRKSAEFKKADARYSALFDSAPDELKNKIRELNRAKISNDLDLWDEIEAELYDGPYSDLFMAIDNADWERRRILYADREFDAYELYRNTAGEIEARDAQARQKYSAEERRKTPPYMGDEDTVFVDEDGSALDMKYQRFTEDEYKSFTDGLTEDEIYDILRSKGEEIRATRQKIRDMKSQEGDWLDRVVKNEKTAEEYAAWAKESGLEALYTEEKQLDKEIGMLSKRYDDLVDQRLEREQRQAIEKSGLTEAEYFGKQAVKTFGYTPYFYDAGYIVPNGKMLNFSGEKGRHFGSRGQDHRAIGQVFATTTGSEAMNRFINYGNIRIMAEAPGLDISAAHEPTPEQYRQIKNFVRDSMDEGYFAVDFTGENGSTVGSMEYDDERTIRADRIVNDIKKFYQTGEVPEVGTRYMYQRLGADTLQEYEVTTAIYDALDHADAGDDNLVKVGRMPKYIRELAGVDGDLYLYRNHTYENIRTAEEAKKEGRYRKSAHYHGVGEAKYAEAVMSLENQALTINDGDGKGNPKIVMVLPVVGDSGSPLVAAIGLYENHPVNGKLDFRPHITLSIHEKITEVSGRYAQGLEERISRAVAEGRIIGYNKEISDGLPVIAHHARVGNITELSLKKNVARFQKEVKDFRAKHKINYQRLDLTTDDTAAEAEGRDIASTRLQSEEKLLGDMVKSLRLLTLRQQGTIEKLQKRLQLTKTQEVRTSDAAKLARKYLREYGSSADAAQIAERLKAVGDYILQTKNIDQDELRNMARNVAAEVLEHANEQVKMEDEQLATIREDIKGKKLTISPEFFGELDGGFDSFRKKAFGKFTLASTDSESINHDEYMSVSQFYADMHNQHGDYYFPDAANEGEEAAILLRVMQAATPMEVNPFENYMGEAVESMANQIVFDAVDGVMRPTPPTDADRAKSTREALKEQIKTLEKEKKISYKEARDYENTIEDLTLRLDKAESKFVSLRESKDSRIAQVQAEGRARTAEVKAKERAESERKIKALKEYYQRQAKRQREMRENAAGAAKYRKAIQKKAEDLRKMLVTNSDKLHVPELLKVPLGDFLAGLDFSSKSLLNRGEATNADKKFHESFRKMLDALSGQQDYFEGKAVEVADLGGYMDISKENLEFLAKTANEIHEAISEGRTYTINRMNTEELRQLSEFLSNVKSAIKNLNTFLANSRFETISEAARGDMEGMKELGAISQSGNGSAVAFLAWSNGTPYYVFKRYGKGGEAIFEGFTKGWGQMAFDAKEIIDFTEKLYSSKEVKEWERQIHEIALSDGQTIRITTAQIMELSMLLNREQALKHIEHGGIQLGDIETKTGKIVNVNKYHLTQEDITSIVGKLTGRQTEVAKALQHFMAVRCAEWGNEVSMRRFGYQFYTEGEYYYPIKTVAADRPMSDNDLQNDSMFRLLNLSSSKSLNPKASNALVVGSIFDTFTTHTADMAKLHGMGLPILDAIKWFNYKEKAKHDDGTYDVTSLQNVMRGALGDQATKYFRTLMKDINGTTESGDRGTDIFSKAMSNYKAAAVAANLRVAFLQPTSYVRAAAVIDARHLVGIVPSRRAYQEAMKYSGTAVWKAQGYYDTDIARGMRGQIKHDETARDAIIDKSMALAELGDKLTWSMLWQASKRQAQAENRSLSGDELNRKAAEIFDKTIYATQVMDSTLTRSEFMRSKSLFNKGASAFMAEPTLSYNLLMDAYSQYNLDARRHGKGKAWELNAKHIGRAFAVYISSATFSAIVESLVDALRDDDDDPFWDKFCEAFLGEKTLDSETSFWERAKSIYGGNLGADMTVIGKLPWLKNIISLIQGYSNKDMAVAAYEEIADVIKIMKGEGSKSITRWGKIYKAMQAVSHLTGFGMSNFARDAVAIWNAAVAKDHEEWRLQKYEPRSDDNADRYIKAVLSGDSARAESVFGKWADAKSAQSAIKSGVKKRVESGGMDRETAETILAAAGVKKKDIDKLLNQWTVKAEYGVSWDDRKEAYLSGDVDRAEMMKILTGNGKSKEDAEELIAKWDFEKKNGWDYSDMKELYLDGNITRQEALTALTTVGGKTADEARKAVDAYDFEKKHGWAWSDRKSLYQQGKVSRGEMKQLLMSREGKSAEEADAQLEVWEWTRDVEGCDNISISAVRKYKEYCAGVGVSKQTFATAYNAYNDTKGTDNDGDGETDKYSKTVNVMPKINALPISAEQKTAIALCFWGQKTVNKYKLW